MTPPRMTRTRTAKKTVSPRNTASPAWPAGRRVAAAGEIATISASAATVALQHQIRKWRGTSTSPAKRSVRDLRRLPGPDRLAIGAGDGLPAPLDGADHRRRHRHVVELLGHLPAIVVGPVEEA